MKTLDATLVAAIASHLNGARLKKFQASVEILNTSLAQGGWVIRGSIKAQSGFYQGLYSKHARHANHQIDMCLSYGHPVSPERLAEFQDKLSATELAWVRLCNEKAAAFTKLNAARPLPKITAIGLSPKVTKTFQECNLDIDVNSIKLAKIEEREFQVQARDKDNRPRFDEHGEPVMMTMTIYIVVWTPGILFNKSRFAYNDCQACGKAIPSRRLVPIEATCRKNGLVALLVGCDCARNIFGVQDIGVERTESNPLIPTQPGV